MTGKLTGSQQGLYLECVADPESTLYNLPFLGLIHENTDPERLKEAVLKAVAAHPALNVVLAEEADGTIVLKRWINHAVSVFPVAETMTPEVRKYN